DALGLAVLGVDLLAEDLTAKCTGRLSLLVYGEPVGEPRARQHGRVRIATVVFLHQRKLEPLPLEPGAGVKPCDRAYRSHVEVLLARICPERDAPGHVRKDPSATVCAERLGIPLLDAGKAAKLALVTVEEPVVVCQGARESRLGDVIDVLGALDEVNGKRKA